jgi:SagB-type dehydrogenase family enzyme
MGTSRWSRRELVVLLLSGAVAAACDGGTAPRPAASTSRRTTTVTPAVVDLPAPTTTGGPSLADALHARHSVRDFARDGLDDQQLGQLLWAAQGVTHGTNGRTAPSAGALYPLELHVLTGSRLLHYLPHGHRAEVRTVDPRTQAELSDAALGQAAVAGAAAVICVSAVVERTRARYGGRAERYVDLEAGHCAQNVLLQAVVLGLGAVPIGSFDDARVADVLALPDGWSPRYLLPVGRPA